jgi:UDP-GlcNAc:undecaprenyl-phosphate/decaprenyl-phosphate GlcNAc-1-phosphate transferase
VHALPFLLALLAAAVLAPPLLKGMEQSRHVHSNYRGRLLPFPFGVLVPAAALLALVPLTLIARFAPSALFHPELEPIALYVLGIALLGLIDDAFGSGTGRAEAPRGWRGHGAALMRGELSTGALKAVGSVGLGLLAMDQFGLSDGRWLLATGVLVLATNVFNLLDLRPGRSIKAFVLLGAALTIGSGQTRSLWALGLLTAPALVAGAYDLRERAMLGDTGSNLLGALAGMWLVLTLSGTGQLIALILLAGITVYGEIRSISSLIERTPGLRELDSWGRPT